MRVLSGVRRGRIAAAGAVVLVLLGAVAVTGHPAATPPDGPPLVYVSGLDDHLLPAWDAVPMHHEPGGAVVAHLAPGALVWVHREVGEWLEVEVATGGAPTGGGPAGGDAAGDAGRRGWIADFHLRGEMHLVDPSAPGCPVDAALEPGAPATRQLAASTRVRLLDVAGHRSGTWVRVRTLRTGAVSWVSREVLSERPGPDVRRAGHDTPCTDISPHPVAPHEH